MKTAKHTKFYLIAIVMLLALSSCSFGGYDSTPVMARFTATVSGKAPNAIITLRNNSIGANFFVWTFSEGVNIASSTDREPVGVVATQAGEVNIRLDIMQANGNSYVKTYIEQTITIP